METNSNEGHHAETTRSGSILVEIYISNDGLLVNLCDVLFFKNQRFIYIYFFDFDKHTHHICCFYFFPRGPRAVELKSFLLPT